MVLLALFLLLADSLVNASCECGFYMNDTKDYFTHVIYNNFSALAPSKKLSTNPAFTNDWAVQDWGIPPKGWVKPLGIDNAEDNVFLRNGNLVLRQQGYSKAQALKKSKVSVASIASQRGDIIHGSFRVELKMENANGGSCGAFFWYHVIANATTVIPFRGDNLLNLFQRHRFDWTKEELRFYQNSTLVHANAFQIPDAPGHAYLNVWADGGAWSGAPSTTDVFLTIKLIAIYHNTSASDKGLDKVFNERCKKAGGPSNVTICLDTSVESGVADPSSSGSAVVPLQLWILSLLCVAFAIVVSAV
ncbi:conserved hypothetical protein [Histoplasma capsulatum H143]|uniref:GH16 domain-containing protein n=1 Tax=Ajellomyces capsulatus (strain H143) TaxID=544712 RepID=C6H3N6_AJECH|nr:conserved hypothetical protein [Histoplasma capsulatum H143]